MKQVTLAIAVHLLAALPSRAADGLSGTWTAGAGPAARVLVFKVAGETF
jgi:hypothetical protein